MVCLPQYGLPEFGSERRGDMYVRVQLHIPEHVSPAAERHRAHLGEVIGMAVGDHGRIAVDPSLLPLLYIFWLSTTRGRVAQFYTFSNPAL